MAQLLNLLGAIALLVWGTHVIRHAILQAFGARLRQVLARAAGNRLKACASGLAVTTVLQSSTATALIVSGFVGQGLLNLPLGLAAMLGADVGTSLMALVFALDLSWLSPLCILAGVAIFISRQGRPAEPIGQALTGLGLMLLALHLLSTSTVALTQSPLARGLLAALDGDVLMAIIVGAVLTLLAYSSLAIVLLTAALAEASALPLLVAFGLVLGANAGSAMLAVLTTARSGVESRRVPLGNLLFRFAGVCVAAPWLYTEWAARLQSPFGPFTTVAGFHLLFNLAVAVLFIGFTPWAAAIVERWLPPPPPAMDAGTALDPDALLAQPARLALSCAARETVRQASVVETMLRGCLPVLEDDDGLLARRLREMDDMVDRLCSSIKRYLSRLSPTAMEPDERRRWSEIMTFTINLEQIADIVERILLHIEKKKIRTGRQFSDAGGREIRELHACLVNNMGLAISVFLDRNLRDAYELVQAKARLRTMERAYADTHLSRLAEQTPESIETSSLHLDLISEFRRVNSHLCAIGYVMLEKDPDFRPDPASSAAIAAG